MKFFKDHKTIFIIAGLITLLCCGLLIGVYYVIDNYKVTTVYVEGNSHYSNEEIMDMVMDGPLGHNSLFLSMKYKNKSVEGIPFIAKMDISVLSPNSIKIEVYEKALAGYIEYLEKYMYFDRDGTVVEISDMRTKGIPLVAGLSFDHVVLYEPLIVDDPDIFDSILDITQLVNKYELKIDKIYFGRDNSITLYFDNVKAALGQPDAGLEEKVMELQYLLPELTGKSGILRLENYSEETKNISFEPDQG